jgi:hypothetical protein
MKSQSLLGRLSSAAFVALAAFAGATPNHPPLPSTLKGTLSAPAFVENKGQWSRHARYVAEGADVSLWITDDGPVYDFYKLDKAWRPGDGIRQRAVSMGLDGFHADSYSPESQLSGTLSYYYGRDKSHWATDVHRFGSLVARDSKDGLAVRYYFDQGSPRYDILVPAGFDPDSLTANLTGADSAAILPNGNLQIETSLGTVEEQNLTAYQEIDGQRVQVACAMTVANKKVGFKVGAFDPTEPLVIDPLVFSTYLLPPAYNAMFLQAGSAQINAIAFDGSGNILAAGTVVFPDYQEPPEGNIVFGYVCGFVCKLNPTATSMIYEIYSSPNPDPLPPDGPTYETSMLGLAADPAGDALVYGTATNYEIPITAGALWPTDSATYLDKFFLMKLNPSGSLIYSTYIDSTNQTGLGGIASDAAGDAYLYGSTTNPSFPTTAGAFETAYPGVDALGNAPAVVFKVNPTGTALLYSTFMEQLHPFEAPGDGIYEPFFVLLNNNIAVDAAGEAMVIGDADAGFPTLAASMAGSLNAGVTESGLVAKLNPSGTGLVYATYLDAKGETEPSTISCDAAGNALMVAGTGDQSFPYTTPVTYYYGNATLKLNSVGSELFAVPSFQEMNAALDASGNIYMVGNAPAGLPTTPDAFQLVCPNGQYESSPYIMIVDPTATDILYCSYIGGSTLSYLYNSHGTSEAASSLVVSPSGNALIAGSTASVNFPTTSGVVAPGPNWPTETPNYGGLAGFLCEFTLGTVGAGIKLSAINTGGGAMVYASVAITSKAPKGGVIAVLTSSSPAATMPASVEIPAGAMSARFSIKTSPVTVITPVTISAKIGTSVMKESLTLSPATFQKFSLSESSVIGGQGSKAELVFGQKAPSSGDPVILSAAAPVNIPSLEIVPNGESSLTFSFGTEGVSSPVTVPIKATFGTTTFTASVSVQPAPLESVGAERAKVVGGNGVIGVVALDGLAGPTGAVVTLSSSGPATLPASTKILTGKSAAEFSISTQAVSAVSTVKIAAAYGSTTKYTVIEVEPASLAGLSVAPETLHSGQFLYGTLSMNGKTGPNGATILLTPSTYLSIPSTVKVAAGSSLVRVPIEALGVDTELSTTFKATYGSETLTASVTIEPASLASFSLAASSVVGGKDTTGTITFNGPTGPKGAIVSLVGAGPISVSHVIVVPAGKNSMTFPIGTTSVTSATTVYLTVSYGESSLTQKLTVTP